MTPNIMGDWTPDEKRDHALNQIQTIAYDAMIEMAKREGDYAVLVEALNRIVNIAEAQEPDEDWRPAMIDGAS